MFRILLKKQLRELTNFFFWDTRRNKKRSKGGIVGFALLFFFLFLSLGMMFFMMTESLMDAFISMDLVWMAFAIVSLLAVVFGIFGGIFNTYASMYNAKDNESLLAMPIAPRAILGARLVGVYLTGFVLVAIVMLPALACYIINSAPPAKNIIFGVLIIFAVSFFVLFLSCLLGWLVALISSRVRKKNLVTTVLSLAFLTGYYYVYFRAAEILKNIIANAGDFSHAFRTSLYPFYVYGRAVEGHLPSLLIAIFGGLLLVVLTWLVLSANFVGIVTRNKGAKKVKYDRSSAAKTSSVSDALFKRELRHFVSNSAYMLNCGLGLLLLVVAAVLVVVKADLVKDVVTMFSAGSGGDVFALIIMAGVALLASMSYISAPSVSLEGENIWIVQTLPVKAADVLKAKRDMHFYLSAIPSLLCAVALCYATGLSLVWYVIAMAFVLVFVEFVAVGGLALNLKSPNLHWTSEAVPIKQSMSVFVTMFGSWVFIGLLALGYWLLHSYLGARTYAVCVIVLVGLISLLLERWIRRGGAEIFAHLT